MHLAILVKKKKSRCLLSAQSLSLGQIFRVMFVPPSRKEVQQEEMHTVFDFLCYGVLLCNIMVDIYTLK